MKAAVFEGNKTIVTKEADIPQIKDSEVLVKVKAAGICGTDVHIYHGSPGSTEPTLPLKPLITHRYPVSRLEEAIKMQMGTESVKVVIVPELGD